MSARQRKPTRRPSRRCPGVRVEPRAATGPRTNPRSGRRSGPRRFAGSVRYSASLRSSSGLGRKSAPFSHSRSNAKSAAGSSAAACRMRARFLITCRAVRRSQIGRPWSSSTTSSESATKSARIGRSSSTSSGKQGPMSRPRRDSRRTESPRFVMRQRKPSCFSSKIQPFAEKSLPGVASIRSRWEIEGKDKLGQ